MSSSTSSEVVVRTRHLGKAYQLYAHRSDWLKQVMLGWYKTYYKPFWVLRDIDLDVYRGDSIGILGRNGCGKSTLLQVICGMTLPSNGELRVTGRVAPVLALGATFDAELSGRENIMIGGAVMGLAWFMCAIGAFTRDAGYLMINIVPLFMFMTPVFFSHSSRPPPWDILLYLNALTAYVEVMRDLVLTGVLPNPLVILWMLATSIFTFYFGYWFFDRYRNVIVDVI